MSQNPTTKTINRSVPSSRNGRNWLNGLSKSPTASRGSSAATETVSIPDLSAETAANPVSTSVDHETLSQILGDASRNPATKNAQTDRLAIADISERPTEWTEKAPPSETDVKRKPPEKAGDPDEKTESNESIEHLCSKILERFPLSGPAVLLFVGSENNLHTDETCAKVSSCLASKKIGKVLLVDSSIDKPELTQASGLLGQPGISDVVNKGNDWEPLVYGGAEINLEFMPAGGVRLNCSAGADNLRKAVTEMKTKYQFICVSAGDAHLGSAKAWSQVCDGSYLLVGLNSTNETYAKSAITELQSSGSRLLGCIVTDQV